MDETDKYKIGDMLHFDDDYDVELYSIFGFYDNNSHLGLQLGLMRIELGKCQYAKKNINMACTLILEEFKTN